MTPVLPLLVVDGYNVLHADPGYRETAAIDIDTARRRLIDDVAVFASGRYEAVIVFDGGGVEPWTPPGVDVRWSGSGEADTIVEALAFEARSAGRPCLVVTTDRATRDAVFGPGIDAVSSVVLLGHLDESREECREAVESHERVTLADRVPSDVRDRLERWARARGEEGVGKTPEQGSEEDERG